MIFLLKLLIVLGSCILIAAYLSLLERKLLGRIQKRLGPSYCGPFGIIQPIADTIKLFLKRGALFGHTKSSIMSVCFFMFASLLLVLLLPISDDLYLFNPDYGLIYILILMEAVSICEVIIGINTSSKYGIIGGIRGYFQLLSAHIPLILSSLCVALSAQSFNILDIVQSQSTWPLFIIMPPVFIIFFITILITLNRAPFDFTEAESELVAGNYVEYGGMLFAMIYLGEYINLMAVSALISLLFLGGWEHIFIPINFIPPYLWMFMKTFAVMIFIIVIRAMLPRYKQKHIIRFSWNICCPILMAYLGYFIYTYKG